MAMSVDQRTQKDKSVLLPIAVTEDAWRVYKLLVFDQQPAEGREPRWHALYGVWVTESGHVYDPNPEHHPNDPVEGPYTPLKTFVSRYAPMVSLHGRTYLPVSDTEFDSKHHRRSVAQLVLETWAGLSPSPASAYSAYHVDGDKDNAHIDNLFWRSKRVTQEDKTKTNTQILEEMKLQIAELTAAITKQFGLSQEEIEGIEND
jgi:hypothetical protein